jgi:hypothetical protein
MKNARPLKILIMLIFFLALFAASMGLFYQTPGQPYPYTNHRGENVTINGHGLYFYDTLSTAAQMQGNDLVTLIVGLPLLVVSTNMAMRNPPRRWAFQGHLLLTGTLGFILYTYLTMSTLTAYNALFLVYVALFGISLYAFILSMMALDLHTLPERFSERLPRKWIATLLFFVGAFLSLAWLARIIQPMLKSIDPALENTTTLVIQTMDLSLIVPLAFLAGILLLRRSAWGFLLATVFVMKSLTLGLGVSAMGINMALAGVPDSLVIIIPFLVITLLNLIAALNLLKNIKA